MNYMAEIRAFYDWVESNPTISASCISLWHGLVFQANKTGWKQEFSVAISTLELRTGLKRGAIYRARNTLKQCGAIDFKERAGSQSAMYRVNSLCLFNEHNCDTNRNTTATQTETQPRHNAKPLLDINDTKQNEEDSKDIMSSEPSKPKTQKPKPQKPDIPALYAELCPNLPQIRALTDKRKEAVSKLIKQIGADDIKSAFVIFNQSDFCRGTNDRGWKADFDFCIKPESITKALEGKYDERIAAGHSANAQPLAPAKKPKFANFTERENNTGLSGITDFSELQRLEMERIDRELGEPE